MFVTQYYKFDLKNSINKIYFLKGDSNNLCIESTFI